MLVERSVEEYLLDGVIEDCAEGGAQVVLIGGGLASGKTALLRAFWERACDKGALLLSATGSRAERTLRMGVLGQLVRSEAVPAELAALAAELASGEIDAHGRDDGDSVVFTPAAAAFARRVCEMVLELARERPVVIAVDDVHFADGPSLQVLLYLIRRMRRSQVCLVLTEWAQPYPTRPWFRGELTRHPYRQIRLAPLSHRGVTELVTSELGQSGAAGLTPAFHAVTGGNPLLVRALAADQLSPAARPINMAGELLVSSAFVQAVLDCLHRWEPSLLEVARGAALLGEDITSSLIGHLTGMELDSVTQVLDVLTEAGLLVGGRFRHPSAEAAVLDGIPPRERAAMHLRAAEMLYQRGMASARIARHIVAADQVARPWAIKVLRDAAEQAFAIDDVEFAGRCLKLALRGGPDERERALITMALATVEWRDNPSAAARWLTPLREALFDRVLTGRDAAAVIRCLLWQGDLEGAAKALAVLVDSNDPADAQIVAELQLTYHLIYGTRQGPAFRETAWTACGGAVPGNGNPWTRTVATLTTMLHRGVRDDVVSSARHLLQSSPLSDATLEIVMTALLALTYVDELDSATTWCDMLLDEAMRRRAVTWQALLGSVSAEIALRRGQLESAEEKARSALDLLPAQSWGILIGYPLSTLLLATTGMGRHDQAASIMQCVVPQSMFDTVIGARYLHARGHHFLETDRVLAAFSDFHRCGDLMREFDLDTPALVPWRSDLAMVHLRLDQCQTARALLSEQLERLGGISRHIKGITLRVMAASSDLQQRPALLRDAIDNLQRSGDRLELARALALLSEVYHEIGEFGPARVMAYRASREAKACGVDMEIPLLAGARGHEQVDPEPEQGESVLSEAERRVASLAALGHTNREISQRLYITPSTVEQHLTRVYRKLNVAGRKDLPAELSPNGVAPLGAASG
ncbi:ATP-binding protein [Sphaerisporangium dianthi]|uniref:ATP-binding protein n=1 Tax=Sphaerisporangium dianthi TaxID=1436120 RepID=A0ABV9CJM2_9ACTN